MSSFERHDDSNDSQSHKKHKASLDSNSTSEEMVSIKIDEIPPFLKSGQFFKSLDLDNSSTDQIIEVPAQCFPTHEDVKDFGKLFRVHQFWGLDELPDNFVQYCLKYEVSNWDHVLVENLSVYEELSVDLDDDEEQYLTDEVKLFRKEFNEALSSEGRSVLFWVIENNQFLNMTEQLICTGLCKEFTDESAISVAAARLGKVDLLKLLHDQGYTFNHWTCSGAANNLETLQYLRCIECPWDARTLMMAGYWGSLQCLEYAMKEGCPRLIDGDDTVVEGEDDDEDDEEGTFQCEDKPPTRRDFITIATASGGDVACMEFLHSHFPVGRDYYSVIMTLINYSFVDCLAYYVKNCVDVDGMGDAGGDHVEDFVTFAEINDNDTVKEIILEYLQ